MSRAPLRRVALLGALLLAVGAFFVFGLDRWLTLEAVQRSLSALLSWKDAHPWTAMGGYLLLFVIVAGLSLPGAVYVGLAGGAVFGACVGTALASVGSTLGATLACAASRYLLGDWVQARFGARLGRINAGLEREGPFFLFTLRLIPAFPFFLINLAMGLTRMRLWTFCWVSWLGMLPGTFVFVNAGRELGRLRSAAGILSPRLLLAFALLGVFPLLARLLVRRYRRRRDRAGA